MMSAGPNVFGVVKDGGVCFFPLVQGACNKLNTPCGLGDTSSKKSYLDLRPVIFLLHIPVRERDTI